MPQGMNQLLAEVFQTKTASAEPTEADFMKKANLEFFEALCREQNINVAELTEPQLEVLFKTAMEMKEAGEEGKPSFPPKKEGKEEEKEEKGKKEAEAKVAAANAEYQEKRAAAIKVAEADFMGRIMAHSLVDELSKIKTAMEEGKPPFPPKKDEKKDDDEKEEAKEKKSSAANAAALIEAFNRSKTASAPASASPGASSTPNFDELAAYHAIDMLKAAGCDPELAFNKVNAAYTLGLAESTKLASAGTQEQALHVRALEICESAGFPVDWTAA